MSTSAAPMTHPLVRTVRRALEQAADPAKAPQMQAYMKSAMPYRGVSSPVLKTAVPRGVHGPSARDRRPNGSGSSWSCGGQAAFREERYAAVLLTESRRYREFRTFASVPMFEEMIVTGAWWDFVDTLAGHNLGDILRAEPRRMKPLMRRWATDEDMWKRRSRDPLSARLQARDGSRAALRLHRAEPVSQGLLHPQSDRLGAAPVRVDRSEGSAALREGEQGSI